MKPPRHPCYARHRFPAEVISHAVWLYFRFPLSLRMVEEMLAARGIEVSYETVRQWALKFGQGFANQIRRRLPAPGDKWHLPRHRQLNAFTCACQCLGPEQGHAFSIA
jgi:putative transposase